MLAPPSAVRPFATAGTGTGVTPAPRAFAAAARPDNFFSSETLLLALRVVGPREDGSAFALLAIDPGVLAVLACGGDTKSISITWPSFFVTFAAGDTLDGPALADGDGLVFPFFETLFETFETAGAAAALALALSARVFFFPDEFGCSSFSVGAVAGRSGDVSASAPVESSLGPAQEGDVDLPFAARPLRFAAGFELSFSLSCCVAPTSRAFSALAEGSLRFAARFLCVKSKGNGQRMPLVWTLRQ